MEHTGKDISCCKLRELFAALIDARLAELLPEAEKKIPDTDEIPWLLENAMRYSVMAGGKRLLDSERPGG